MVRFGCFAKLRKRRCGIENKLELSIDKISINAVAISATGPVPRLARSTSTTEEGCLCSRRFEELTLDPG